MNKYQVIYKTLVVLIVFLLFACNKNTIELQTTIATIDELNPIGIWDVTNFKHINYSVGTRFEAPKGLTMNITPDGKFNTINIPHIFASYNLSGNYTLNKTEKTITITGTQFPTQPKLLINNDFGRVNGRLIFMDRATFLAEYELVKRK